MVFLWQKILRFSGKNCIGSVVMNKICIVSPYFGKLPEYIQLWLYSCAKNSKFTWVVHSDADWSGLVVPDNVIVIPCTFEYVRGVLRSAFEFKLQLNSAYKICDYRPALWLLLDDAGISYDYWGHCDFDMIFGDLNKYVSDELLERFDKIFGVGHLTIYRNDIITKLIFATNRTKLNFRTVSSVERNLGFDEHYGVNSIWKNLKLRQYINESIIADVLPDFNAFVIGAFFKNRPKVEFLWDDGRIYMVHWSPIFGVVKKEFMYVHLQKRRMPIMDSCDSMKNVFRITVHGFYEGGVNDWGKSGFVDWSIDEYFKYIKLGFRKLKRKVTGYEFR